MIVTEWLETLMEASRRFTKKEKKLKTMIIRIEQHWEVK